MLTIPDSVAMQFAWLAGRSSSSRSSSILEYGTPWPARLSRQPPPAQSQGFGTGTAFGERRECHRLADLGSSSSPRWHSTTLPCTCGLHSLLHLPDTSAFPHRARSTVQSCRDARRTSGALVHGILERFTCCTQSDLGAICVETQQHVTFAAKSSGELGRQLQF